MYPTVPPAAPDDGLPAPHPDYDVTLREPSWRHRTRWRALRRLSVICKILAPVAALFCILLAVMTFIQANRPRYDYGDTYSTGQASGGPALIMILIYGVSAVFSFFFWLGIGELLLLFIEVERNTRHVAARMSKNRGPTPLEVTELVEDA